MDRCITSPQVRSIAISVSACLSWVCLSVCLLSLFVCTLAHLKNRMFKFHAKFSVHVTPPRPWFGPPLMTVQYVCASGFVDDVMFSHNGPNVDRSLEFTTQRIIHRDSPGGAAKLHTRAEVCYRRLPCLLL